MSFCSIQSYLYSFYVYKNKRAVGDSDTLRFLCDLGCHRESHGPPTSSPPSPSGGHPWAASLVRVAATLGCQKPQKGEDLFHLDDVVWNSKPKPKGYVQPEVFDVLLSKFVRDWPEMLAPLQGRWCYVLI